MKGRGNSGLEEPGGWKTMPGGEGFTPSLPLPCAPHPPACTCARVRVCYCSGPGTKWEVLSSEIFIGKLWILYMLNESTDILAAKGGMVIYD